MAESDKGARWEPAELAEVVDGLFEGGPTVYSPTRSPLRRLAGFDSSGKREGV